MNAPRHLFAEWPSIQRRLRRADYVALFTDFDGTLVEIRTRPEQVRVPERARRALALTARQPALKTLVGVVSGRTLEDVRARVGLPGLWYSGAHGYFLLDPTGRALGFLSDRQKERIDKVCRLLEARLAGMPGIRLEPKRATVAVHYREAPRRTALAARRVVTQLLRTHAGLWMLPGKMVWDILPARSINKWTAVRMILRLARKDRPRGRWLLIYLGDDLTDEHVFAKMPGISVVVGRRRSSAARYFLHSPDEVRQFLERFRREREARQPGL